ncbi:MAG: HepT-like ribonuclease domain-containing protein [Patescibacteria group bacterium]
MSKEFILKKLEQMKILVEELALLSSLPFADFKNKFTNIRSAERNFQLIIELASDINAHISAERKLSAPDTYRESFVQMTKIGVLPMRLKKSFIESSNLRNILIHKYDFDEDNFIFYKSLKKFIPLYQNYISFIHGYLNK